MTGAGPPTRWVAIVLVGALAGFLAGLFGVGGGILLVPGMVLFAGMDQRLAHGTSLAAVLPISIASLIAYVGHDNVDWAVAGWLIVGALGGAVLGTALLNVLPARTLGMVFAIVLIASAARLLIGGEAVGRLPLSVGGAVALVAIGVVTGVLAGLLGVGGGILMVPAMIILFGVPPVVAKGTSAAVIVPTAVMGTWRNRRKGNADLRVAAILGAGGVVTAAIGGTLADRMSSTTSNLLFGALLLVVAARLLWQLRREPVPVAPPAGSTEGSPVSGGLPD